MSARRARWSLALTAFLFAGCAHDPPPKAPVAEEPIVNAPADANAKPLPEIDPNKPLAHAKDVKMDQKPNCYRTGGRQMTCK